MKQLTWNMIVVLMSGMTANADDPSTGTHTAVEVNSSALFVFIPNGAPAKAKIRKIGDSIQIEDQTQMRKLANVERQLNQIIEKREQVKTQPEAWGAKAPGQSAVFWLKGIEDMRNEIERLKIEPPTDADFGPKWLGAFW